jgi:hypothetical protein
MTAVTDKAKRVCAAVGGACSPAQFLLDLAKVYSECLVHLTGDHDRDLGQVTVKPGFDSGTGDHWAEYYGIGIDTVRTTRLYIGLTLAHSASPSLGVVLVATKGNLVADYDTVPLRGTDPRVGNSLLVARALHLTAAVGARSGLRTITNNPRDQYLAALYQTMGFAKGTLLDLSDQASVERCFDYALLSYAKRPSVALAHP